MRLFARHEMELWHFERVSHHAGLFGLHWDFL